MLPAAPDDEGAGMRAPAGVECSAMLVSVMVLIADSSC
jgi:hypothetical protein